MIQQQPLSRQPLASLLFPHPATSQHPHPQRSLLKTGLQLALSLGLFTALWAGNWQGDSWMLDTAAQARPRFSKPLLKSKGAARIGSRGGASRGGCRLHPQQPPFVALMPEFKGTNNLTDPIQVLGTTHQSQPRLWFNFPFDPTTVEQISLRLNDEQGHLIQESRFQPPAASGLVALPLPAPLAEGKAYEWRLKVSCAATSRSTAADARIPTTVDYPFAKGWVERTAVTPAIATQLAQGSASERAARLMEQNLWIDAVNAIAEELQAKPQDPNLRADWLELLETVGLKTYATQPLLPAGVPSPGQPSSPASPASSTP